MNRLLAAALLSGAILVTAGPALADGITYVPLGEANEILAIETTNDVIVGRFTEIPQAHGLAGTPDGRLLIAGSFAETSRQEAELPPKPAGISQSEHQAHHAKPAPGGGDNDGTTSFISVVRTADGAILRRIEVPGAVHHTAVTPDGRYAVATHPNGQSISVIDLDELVLVTSLRTGPLPNYAVVSPDGGKIYVSNAGNDTVSEIDTKHWVVRRTVSAGPGPEHLVLSPDGETLYVANADAGRVSEISLSKGAVVRSLEVGGALHGLDLSDDGQTLFISGMEQGMVATIDLESGNLRSRPLGPSPFHVMAVSGAGKLYVSSAEEPVIWVVDQKTLSVLREISIPGIGHQMFEVQG